MVFTIELFCDRVKNSGYVVKNTCESRRKDHWVFVNI